VSGKDRSGMYRIGARALKVLAARCGEAHLARVLDDHAERFRLKAEESAREEAPPEPPRLVAAKRPEYGRQPQQGRNPTPVSPARPTNVVDLASTRRGRGK
jgi:hypothetical protein